MMGLTDAHPSSTNRRSGIGRLCGLQIRRSTIGSESSTVPKLPAALERARLCANVASENRGREILVIDLRKVTTLADFFVIASGTSRRQIHAMADEIDRALSELGEKKMGIEGYNESHWVLLDYGDVVVHLFDDNTRRYYDLENLWGDAPRVNWEHGN
jgi:ribosome-associated protein